MLNGSRFIITVDVGTTNIRSCIYDEACTLQFYNERRISLIYDNQDGTMHVEIDPEKLFADFTELVAESIAKIAHISQLAGLGICCQRNTFISWNRHTLKPYHRLITWKDCRAVKDCKRWNNSFLKKLLNLAGRIAFFFTRSQRYKAASFYKSLNTMVTHRFTKILSTNTDMQEALSKDELQLATLDTWLVHKLTMGQSCFTEPSNASSTGLFDPFLFDWGYTILGLIGFPVKTLPNLKNSAGKELCCIDESIFGTAIPLLSLIGDSQAGVVGANCIKENMIKISLGTGTFFNITSSKPYASLHNVYPLVGWSLPDRCTYTIESCSNDSATSIEWALSVGLCQQIEDTSKYTDEDAQTGLCFVPAFSGMQMPVEDDAACAGFLGLRPNTTKKQMMFAVIESVAFRVKQIWDTFRAQHTCPERPIIRLCGGISKNDFVCQRISDLLGQPVEQLEEPEFCSARGAALLAGLTAGMWTLDKIDRSAMIKQQFEPCEDFNLSRYKQWLKATERCLKFY